MKFFGIENNDFSKIKTLVFDIDGTLYTSDEYVKEQVDCQIRHYADIHGIGHDDARKMILDFRKDFAKKNEGKSISLGNAFIHFGISIDTSIEWRNSLLHPENYLKPNRDLIKTLETLGKRFNLICVTNNPVDAARKTLKAIGIDGMISDIIGLDTCKKSKPDRAILEEACCVTNSRYPECLSIGDRFDIDIALPLELGMKGMLVDGDKDIVEFSKMVI